MGTFVDLAIIDYRTPDFKLPIATPTSDFQLPIVANKRKFSDYRQFRYFSKQAHNRQEKQENKQRGVQKTLNTVEVKKADRYHRVRVLGNEFRAFYHCAI